MSQEAQDLGANALMVLPPYFLKTDGDGLMFYYEAISQAIGRCSHAWEKRLST